MVTLYVTVSYGNDIIRDNIVSLELSTGITAQDYLAAALACESNGTWENDLIKVSDGIVTVTIDNNNGARMSVRIPAYECTQQFIQAYQDLKC